MSSYSERVKIQLKSQRSGNKINMWVNPTKPISLESILEKFPDALDITYKEEDGSFT